MQWIQQHPSVMSSSHHAIGGDFNLSETEEKEFSDYVYNTFTLHQVQLISESPTDYGSMLDLLYTSDQHVLHGVLESCSGRTEALIVKLLIAQPEHYQRCPLSAVIPRPH